MSTTISIRILLVGRSASVANALATLFAANRTLPAELPDDDPDERGYLLEFLAVTNQKAALDQIRVQPPSIIMLETNAKSESRVRFLEMVRYRLPTAAIVAVSRNEPPNMDRFDGFVAAPICPQEALALVRHVCHAFTDHRLQRGPVLLNVATRTVVTPNGRYRMTPKQCALLQLLMMRHGQVVPRADIMQTIWETSYLEDTRTLYVHIRWLRECIEPDPSVPIYLVTVRGVGYRLNLDEGSV